MWKTTNNSSNCSFKALEEYSETNIRLSKNQIVNEKTLGCGNLKKNFEYMSDFPLIGL
jgi:hypothetical protein